MSKLPGKPTLPSSPPNTWEEMPDIPVPPPPSDPPGYISTIYREHKRPEPSVGYVGGFEPVALWKKICFLSVLFFIVGLSFMLYLVYIKIGAR